MTEDHNKNGILIADDEPVFRRMLRSFLLKWGYEVLVAKDGTEALRILQRNDAPPLAVLDWTMPGMEGPQVCRRVRERSERPYVYILLLSGRDQREDIIEGLESGADDYLTKPFDADELRARLRIGQRIRTFRKAKLSPGKNCSFGPLTTA